MVGRTQTRAAHRRACFDMSDKEDEDKATEDENPGPEIKDDGTRAQGVTAEEVARGSATQTAAAQVGGTGVVIREPAYYKSAFDLIRVRMALHHEAAAEIAAIQCAKQANDDPEKFAKRAKKAFEFLEDAACSEVFAYFLNEQLYMIQLEIMCRGAANLRVCRYCPELKTNLQTQYKMLQHFKESHDLTDVKLKCVICDYEPPESSKKADEHREKAYEDMRKHFLEDHQRTDPTQASWITFVEDKVSYSLVLLEVAHNHRWRQSVFSRLHPQLTRFDLNNRANEKTNKPPLIALEGADSVDRKTLEGFAGKRVQYNAIYGKEDSKCCGEWTVIVGKQMKHKKRTRSASSASSTSRPGTKRPRMADSEEDCSEDSMIATATSAPPGRQRTGGRRPPPSRTTPPPSSQRPPSARVSARKRQEEDEGSENDAESEDNDAESESDDDGNSGNKDNMTIFKVEKGKAGGKGGKGEGKRTTGSKGAKKATKGGKGGK